jgi:uncharacterized protein Veg
MRTTCETFSRRTALQTVSRIDRGAAGERHDMAREGRSWDEAQRSRRHHHRRVAGIGAAFARRFAAEGAKVAIVNRDQKKAGAVIDSIRASGGEAITVEADIGRVGEIEAAVTRVVEAYGTVHILLNNAGLYLMSRLGQTTEAPSMQ